MLVDITKDPEVEVRDRTLYGSDEEFLGALFRSEVKIARKLREKAKYGIEEVRPRILVVGPGFQVARAPLAWGSQGLKRRVMYIVGLMAKVNAAHAVLVSADSRRIDTRDFAYHFRNRLTLPPIEDPAYSKAFQDQYQSIMQADYQGNMGNLPRHLYTEAMLTVLKTPQKTLMQEQRYTRGQLTRPVWMPDREDRRGGYEDYLIPNWWEMTDDDPDVEQMAKTCLDILGAMPKGDTT